MTSMHYYYWLFASGGTLLDGFSVVSLGIAIPLLKQELAITPILVGLIGSALVLGAVLGALLGGIIADRMGRKFAFIADMAILVAGSVLCAVARDPASVLAGQFMIGVGIGIDFPTSGAYVSEITPRALRSRMTVATIALQSVGMVLAAVVAIAIFRAHASETDWRLLLGTGGLLAVIYMGARLFLPESPRWLAEKGRLAEAAEVLSRLISSPVSMASVENSESAATSRRSAPEPLGFTALFNARYRIRTLLVSVPWLMMDVATYGVGLFTPVILGAMHLDSARTGSGTVAAVLADAKGSEFVDLFLLAGFVVGVWIIPRFGRISMQVAGFAGMALGMLLLLFAAMTGDGPHTHLWLVIAGFVLFNFTMNAGPNATTFTLPSVLFPTAIRASASGFAAACAKAGATFGTFVVPQLQAAWGLAGVLSLMAFVSIGGLIVTASFAYVVGQEDKLEESTDES